MTEPAADNVVEFPAVKPARKASSTEAFGARRSLPTAMPASRRFSSARRAAWA
jgi:hypothetical protein